MTEPKQTFGMDVSASSSFVRFFRSLPEKSDTTIRFFSRADYYTCHGKDAIFAANEVFKSTSVIKMLGMDPHKLEGVILNKTRFENFIKELLLVKRYRVEVYVNQGTNKNLNWVLEYKGSPGNLAQFEDILFGNADDNPEPIVTGSIMAIKAGVDGKSRMIGVSCVDTMTTMISVAEFSDDSSYSNLEALVVTNAPKECLLIQEENSQEFQNIKSVLERNNVLVTFRKKKEFSTESLLQDLNKLIKFKKGQQENAYTFSETKLELAMAATSAIIKYLDLTSDEGNINQFNLEQIKQNLFLKLDSSAIIALGIDPPPEEKLGFNRGAPMSINGLLDRCKTAQGHRLLSLWLKQPLQDLSMIKERHDIVEFLINNHEVRSIVNEDLKRFPDLDQLAKRILRKNARLRECCRIYECVQRIPVLIENLSVSDAPAALKSIADPLKDCYSDMEKYQSMIEETVDLDSIDSGEYLIKASYTEELQELYEQMNKVKGKIEKEFNEIAKDLDLEAGKNIKLESAPQHGYFLRVTMKDEKILRSKKHYKVFDSNKSGVKFRNSKMEELNERYSELQATYENEQKTIVTEVLSIAATYCGPIRSIAMVIARLDVLTSFALVATTGQSSYVRPKMLPNDAGILKLVKARHPCLENREDINYVPNDIEFKREESEFHIITGPNMGGKSTHLKTAGVAVLMAHIGSFVPCDEAQISLVDSIFARVGADDNQTKGLSTFMAEMTEMAYIMKNATSNSLILIDELGRGTSTYDGRGLAWAIAEDLAKNTKAFTFFATHFHEITRLSEEIPTVKNFHVTALTKENDVIFLYEVKPGACDESFGIHVARMVNFPEELINYALKKQNELENNKHIFEGFFKGNDDDTAEKKRKAVVEGDKLIQSFLNNCKKIDLSQTEEAIEKQIEEYKKEVLNHENPYISALLTKEQ